MIRQAHAYLVGAMGGATLIGISIAVFVMLVSAQVFTDWPIAALGGGGNATAEVSTAHPVGGPTTAATDGSAANPGAAASGSSRVGGKHAGGGSGSVAGGDGTGASGTGQGTTTEQGGSATGPAQGGGSGNSPQSPGSSTSSGSSSSNSGGSGGGGGSESANGTTSSPSGQVTETVDNTVSNVDEKALNGTLHETGVTEVTEGVVNDVAGPESPVGHVVDETAGAVGGLLHGNH
jgi:hypothetical protein